jgi:hypothetical protein
MRDSVIFATPWVDPPANDDGDYPPANSCAVVVEAATRQGILDHPDTAKVAS